MAALAEEVAEQLAEELAPVPAPQRMAALAEGVAEQLAEELAPVPAPQRLGLRLGPARSRVLGVAAGVLGKPLIALWCPWARLESERLAGRRTPGLSASKEFESN